MECHQGCSEANVCDCSIATNSFLGADLAPSNRNYDSSPQNRLHPGNYLAVGVCSVTDIQASWICVRSLCLFVLQLICLRIGV